MDRAIEERFEVVLRGDRPVASALQVLSEGTLRERSKQHTNDDEKILAVWLREKYNRLLSLVGNDASEILHHQLDLLDKYHDDDCLRGLLLDVIPSSLCWRNQEDQCVTLVCNQLMKLVDANPRYTLSVLNCLVRVSAAQRFCIDWAVDRAFAYLSYDDEDLPCFMSHILSLIRKTEEALVFLPLMRTKVKKIIDETKLRRSIQAITQAFVTSPNEELLFQTYQKHVISRADEELILLDIAIILAISDREGLQEWMPHLPLPLVEAALEMNQARINPIWVMNAHLFSGKPCTGFLNRVYSQLPPNAKCELVVLIINHYKSLVHLIETLIVVDTEAVLPLRGTFVALLRTETNETCVEVLCRILVKLDAAGATKIVLLKALLFSVSNTNKIKGLYFAKEVIRSDISTRPTVSNWVQKILFPPWHRPIEPKIGMLCMDCLERERQLTFSELQRLLANTGLVQANSSYKRRTGTLLAFEKKHSATRDPEKNGIVFCIDLFLQQHLDLKNPATWLDCVQWVFRLVHAYLHEGLEESGRKWNACSWLSAALELSSLVLPGTSSSKRRLELFLNDFDSPISKMESEACLCGSYNVNELNHDQQFETFMALSEYLLGVIVGAAMSTTVLQSSLQRSNGARKLNSIQTEHLQRLLILIAKTRMSLTILDDLSRVGGAKLQKSQLGFSKDRSKSPMTVVSGEKNVRTSLSMLKHLQEKVFTALPFLCSDALWQCLDTNILLRCIKDSLSQDTTSVGISDSLAVQTQTYNLLHSGIIQGHITTTDLDESKIIKSISLFFDLFQIMDELPMIEKRVPIDKEICLLLERAVGSLMRFLQAMVTCFQSKTWPSQSSVKALDVSNLLFYNSNEQDLAKSFFMLLLQRVKLISSRELCDCSMDLLVQLGLAAGDDETLEATKLSWSSLQSSLELRDTFKISDNAGERDSVLPTRKIFDKIPIGLKNMPWLLDASKRPLACGIIIRHFARLCTIRSTDAWKNSTSFHFFVAYTDKLFLSDSLEDDVTMFEALLLICVIAADHCKSSLAIEAKKLLLDILSLLGSLGRLYMKKVDTFPQPTESFMLRASESVLHSAIAVVEQIDEVSESYQQPLLDHVALEVVGTYSSMLEYWNSKQDSRTQLHRIKSIEGAREKALTLISDCVTTTGLLLPQFASIPDPGGSYEIDLQQVIETHSEVDDMSIEASFTVNWGKGVDQGSSEQSLELETPTVVFQTM